MWKNPLWLCLHLCSLSRLLLAFGTLFCAKLSISRPVAAQKPPKAKKAVQAAAAEYVAQSESADALDPDSSYPDWVRPHLAEIREQAKRQWTLYVPKASLPIPEIVIQCCDDELVPDSPESMYSCDTASSISEVDTPPPTTPTLASPVSFYFPASPTFSAGDYLQVPPPSFNAPREEDKPVTRNVSNVSGRTFTLTAPPGRSTQLNKTRERRKADCEVQAQALMIECDATRRDVYSPLLAHFTKSKVGRGSGANSAVSHGRKGSVTQASGGRITAVGLGLHFRSKLGFHSSLDTALASDASGTGRTTSSSASDNRRGDRGSCSVSQAFAATSDVAFPAAGAVQIDANASSVSSGRVARLVEAFDSSHSLASVDSGHVKLTDILEDYYSDLCVENIETAAEEERLADAGLVVHETHARRAVVVYAV
ncbi:hypothetical protein BN946_scf185015.g22 [Trametes cinnabarina]|uniref:Uncharacterized protein n=1 Tax=Pycnoporus cinnabarinus TaxID=5643 RepID=A0A060SN84_PYCCI|nr:hypothetical protein BN946_scf185015.g22 [Trametes cinnabarina]